MPIDLLHFVRKWNAATLTERSAAPQHFRDLCEALAVPHPTEIDEIGAAYTFEKRVTKAGTGEQGFADVWKRGWFAWEYKSKGGDLKKAYKQLNEYHESLDNPPLLVVCDFIHFEVHTKFENAPPRVFAFTLDDLLVPSDTATCALPPLDVLRHVFGDFNQLRPERVAIPVTRAAAADFLRLAERLENHRALSPVPPTKEAIAHFLMRLVFCLFADSVELLPDSTFRRLVRNQRHSPISFNRALPHLFEAMSQPDSFFGPANIPYFNGGLFKDDAIIPLDHADLGILSSAAHHDWSHIEPAIFGTLFERSLDSAKRSMIGAHYTSPEDITLLVDPVVMAPLRRRWDTVREATLEVIAREPPLNKDGRLHASLRANRPALVLLQQWTAELSSVRILDPACGSGNFLYIALKKILDLWYEARIFALKHGLALAPEPIPNPTQLYGIEIDFYAHEIASIVVWIGFLQWKRDHAEEQGEEPLLKPLTNIQHADAILRYDEQGKPYEPDWPNADFIIGNPPFLGDKRMRAELNIEPHPRYVDDVRTLYSGRVPGGADLVTYWFEKARAAIAAHPARAGLLATNSISMVGNRPVLERISKSGNIFMAWSDRPWVLAGAAVRVSMIGFDEGTEQDHVLDGLPVQQIHADLTGESNVASAVQLNENANLCFLGMMKGGPFDITAEEAGKMLSRPVNPNGRPNTDVVKRRLGGRDITGRDSRGWIIDFREMVQGDAALYEWPFEYVKQRVKPLRDLNRDNFMRVNWWRHGRSRPELRRALGSLSRCIVTPEVSKHRLFVWMDTSVVPDHTCHVIARQDDYFLGLVDSELHELWSLAQGAWMGKGNDPRYSSERTFDTFPFPWPPGAEPTEAGSPQVRAIAKAARELVRLRDAWLNPPGATEDDLKQRTLTKLYNDRVANKATWLDNLHRTLDEAVFAAYGWPPTLTKQEILAHLLALNHERAAAQPQPKPKKPRRTPTPTPTEPPSHPGQALSAKGATHT